VVDVYRKKGKAQKNILNVGLYLSFFPQLIAGPIVRYETIAEQIENRKETIQDFSKGCYRFMIGLIKKIMISNQMAMIADMAFDNQPSSVAFAWLGAIAYMIQIYYDFSGYSDMAIGLGKILGFDFMENFNYPYISKSITEFWRRWHISLSTWFKQYLYIPLGGNRKGKLRTYINLLIVFFATGLWHGASWNFVVWGGLFYGSILVIERLFLKNILDNNKHKILNSIYVLLIVIIGWVIFRADGLRHALSLIKMMFSFDFKTTYVLLPTYFSIKEIIIIILSIFLCGFGHNIVEKLKCKDKLKKIYEDKLEIFVIILILAISITELVSSTYNPFIYFRF
jgi:alginate O-acetyltransferase complex protein AlgI